MNRLNLAQRIVLVIAWAVVLQVLGVYIVTLGNGAPGWIAYAPLSNSVDLPHLGLAPWLRVIVWVGLVVIWALGALWLLKTRESRTGSGIDPRL